MSRIKISEYRAKKILGKAFGIEYMGRSVDLSTSIVDQISDIGSGRFVVKVDQAVKKRNKLGLVFVNRSIEEVLKDLEYLQKNDYKWALVEPFVQHKVLEERFVALQRDHDGILLTYSSTGGVNVEEHKESVQTCLLDHTQLEESSNTTDLNNNVLRILYNVFTGTHMTYLEINPALIEGKKLVPLDAAAEVDSAAMFFVSGEWGEDDIREAGRKTEAEAAVEELNRKSPASFNLKLLNKDAGIFLLLSGGGASVVVADEFATQGLHDHIANYGEYSGNPNKEETYLYAKQVLQLLVNSEASKKVLMIGGGTANFTDISKTFQGIVQALTELSDQLKKQNVSIYVRRGGPNYRQGLKSISEFLLSANLRFMVFGPEKPIAQLVRDISEELHA